MNVHSCRTTSKNGVFGGVSALRAHYAQAMFGYPSVQNCDGKAQMHLIRQVSFQNNGNFALRSSGAHSAHAVQKLHLSAKVLFLRIAGIDRGVAWKPPHRSTTDHPPQCFLIQPPPPHWVCHPYDANPTRFHPVPQPPTRNATAILYRHLHPSRCPQWSPTGHQARPPSMCPTVPRLTPINSPSATPDTSGVQRGGSRR